jgi:glycosyltransferase involved in cell wall biosynthesis
VVIEALCCGLPVVSSSVAGIPEAINNDNGILMESENEEQLVNALQKIMTRYSNYNRPEIAREAQAIYSYEKIGKQFSDLYETISSK